MSAQHSWAGEKRPQDCWDWVTPEDLTRHAMAAWQMARAECRPPAGARFLEVDGGSWCDRETFAINLVDCFEMRVKAHAHGLGIGDFGPDAARLLLWEQPPVATSRHAGDLVTPAQAGVMGAPA